MTAKSEGYLRGELCGSNAFASARGLALLASVMANGGEKHGLRLMGRDTWNRMHGGRTLRRDVWQMEPAVSPTEFSRGGVAFFR